MAYDPRFAELKTLLKRASLLQRWSHDAYFELDNRWHVEFSAAVRIADQAHYRPVGATCETFAQVDLSLILNGERDFDGIEVCDGQVLIEGLTAGGHLLRHTLHLDRHGDGEEANDLHPRFHWQIGGANLDDVSDRIDGVLMLEGPRWPTYPLDPILLIDFILGQFNGLARRALLEDPAFVRYPRLLHVSQSQFVRPFFDHLAGTLSSNPFAASPYWPSLHGLA